MKTIVRCHYIPIKKANIKKLTITSEEEDVQQLTLNTLLVGGQNHFGKQLAVSYKVKFLFTI